MGDFDNLAEALDYAASGLTGFNFFGGAGDLQTVLPYSALRSDARRLARQLLGLHLERGSRVALVAETSPDFMRFFFACQYAGLVPVPLPSAVHLGGRDAYVGQLRRLLINCRASLAVAPQAYRDLLMAAQDGLELVRSGTPRDFRSLPPADADLVPSRGDELAYLQYTSGSTRFPRGVMINQHGVINNLKHIIRFGLKARAHDRCTSWLPYYHDMGLVGMVLAPLAAQVTVDYLSPRDFAMRPRLWLKLIARNQATISFSPPFGYELCLQRLRPSDIQRLNLSSWRVAGVGAEPIRPEPLANFANILKPAGFDRKAFVAGYGMAECALAVSFTELGKGLIVESVDGDQLALGKVAAADGQRFPQGQAARKCIVNCGIPLPDYEVDIRDPNGLSLPERRVGNLFVRGPSVMTGYFGDSAATREVLASDGWLNTGDLAYRRNGGIVVTGRANDLIIINGRNIWPQDLEYIAEQHPEVRTGDASAFTVPDARAKEQTVLVIQCRLTDPVKRSALARRVRAQIRREYGVECLIELVPRNTLPRTTSGKLSRSRAREDYLERNRSHYPAVGGIEAPQHLFA
jgi:fatty-acyl-CoA synthase